MPPVVVHFVILAAAIAAALILHALFYRLVGRTLGRVRPRSAEAVSRGTSQPVRVLLILIAISMAAPPLFPNAWREVLTAYAVQIAYICVLAWLAIGLVETFSAVVKSRLPEDIHADVRARRVHTQIQLFRQILLGLILFASLAGICVTFPYIRNLGAGLFASAGLAGLALGMAARPALANLIAGVQVALTEPIRIGDVVVVEGEWGRIWEVNTTNVVVRLWDLRHLIVPLAYFIEHPFQNWTRYSSEILGAVILHADYSIPVDDLRAEYDRLLAATPLWDGEVKKVQVTEARERTIEIRFLMSAADAPAAFELRCLVREKMIAYIQREHAYALPKLRAVLDGSEPAA